MLRRLAPLWLGSVALGGWASDSEVAMGLCECMVSCETNKRVA